MITTEPQKDLVGLTGVSVCFDVFSAVTETQKALVSICAVSTRIIFFKTLSVKNDASLCFNSFLKFCLHINTVRCNYSLVQLTCKSQSNFCLTTHFIKTSNFFFRTGSNICHVHKCSCVQNNHEFVEFVTMWNLNIIRGN